MTVPAETSQLSRVRREVADSARQLSADPSIADDLSLAVSELMTNAIHHSTDSEVTIVVQRRADVWSIEVSGAADGLNLQGLQPTPSEPTGRGLLIVRSIMDTVELVRSSNEFRIRCTKSIA